jgi:hypothetical protein
VTGDQVDIPMTLELRESGRVRGQVVGADGTPLSAKLNASLVGQGYRVHQSFADANLRLAVPEPGTYVLTVTGPAVLQRTVVVGQGQDLDLGALRLVSGGGVLAATSSLTAVPAEVLPGGLAQLRAVVDLPTARAGSARLALPPAPPCRRTASWWTASWRPSRWRPGRPAPRWSCRSPPPRRGRSAST